MISCTLSITRLCHDLMYRWGSMGGWFFKSTTWVFANQIIIACFFKSGFDVNIGAMNTDFIFALKLILCAT